MSTKSEFTAVGLAHKLLLAGEKVGYTSELFNALAERTDLLKQFLDVQCGRATIVPKRPFIEMVDGVTHIIVTSDGRTDEDFISLWEKHYRPSDYAKEITRRAKFIPTTGVTYRIPIITGKEFSDSDRLTKNIRKEAARRNYRTLPFEAACLLREAVSDEELERLGLWWLIGMHDPIEDSDRDPNLLGVDRGDDGRRVHAYYSPAVDGWRREFGFAFLAPQDQS